MGPITVEQNNEDFDVVEQNEVDSDDLEDTFDEDSKDFPPPPPSYE